MLLVVRAACCPSPMLGCRTGDRPSGSLQYSSSLDQSDTMDLLYQSLPQLADCMAGWLADWLVGWLTGWLPIWQTDCLGVRLAVWALWALCESQCLRVQ